MIRRESGRPSSGAFRSPPSMKLRTCFDKLRVSGQRPAGARNERGIALIIVLVVVALLTITVTEFTYSVQLDQHRLRNSIHALQASLLARSGINLAEGFLMQDDEPRFDAFTEEWWLALDEFCGGLELDPGMYVRCRVRDESGKINVNGTRGTRRVTEDQRVTSDAVLRDALRRIFEAHEIDVEIVDRLAEYWAQDPPEPSDGRQLRVPDFGSLEDFAATFGIPTDRLLRLREILTAQRGYTRININTAPAEVLAAVINEPGAVSDIVDRQMQEEPFTNVGEIAPLLGDVENANVIRGLFTVNSRLFRLEASAITNANPTALRRGGIGQTLSVLVYRIPDLRRRQEGEPGWTLRPLDWQKEGGARLFRGAGLEEDRSQLTGGLGTQTSRDFLR
jgi:general secretion pathway protein K